MMNFMSVMLFTFTAAPVPRANTDEWLGDNVFPRTMNIPLEDEKGNPIGTWSVANGIVIWANNKKVQVRHTEHPGPYIGYAKKSDLIRLADAAAFFSSKVKEDPRSIWALQNRATAWSLKGEH